VYQESNQGEMNLKALLNNRENFPHIKGNVIGGGEFFSGNVGIGKPIVKLLAQ
jgi:hypothetical protein